VRSDRAKAADASQGPVRLQVYVAGLIAVAIAMAARLIAAAHGDIVSGIAQNVALLALLTSAEYFMVRFTFRGEVMGITLFEAMLAPLLFVAPGIQVVALVATAEIISAVLHRDRPLKASFNVAQWVIAAGLGSTVFHAIATGSGLSPRNTLALVVGMSVIAVTNLVLFTEVMRLAQGRALRSVARSLIPSILLGFTLNTPFGLLFVAAYEATPMSVAAFVVPLIMLRWAHRSYAAVSADKARLDGLHRATRELVAPMDPRDALPRFLDEIRTSFGAEAVDLVMPTAGGRTVHRVHDGGYTSHLETEEVVTLASELLHDPRAVRLTTTSAYGAALSREGWRVAIAAPVIADGRPIGVLVAYDAGGPEGFESGELAVLQALAREVGGAIHKGALVSQVIEERQKLADIVEQTSDGIVTLAPDGTVLTWNPGFERISGYTSHEMLGARGIDRMRPRDEAGNDLFVERWAITPTEIPSIVQIRTSDGELRWVSCSVTRVSDPDGSPRVLVLMVRDVTKAREVERLKDDFVATVSHELRTPLTPIKGWAETLARSAELMSVEERSHAASSILNQAEHLERLITNLLEVSQIERSSGKTRNDAVDIRAVTEKVWRSFRQAHPTRSLMLEVHDDVVALGDEVFAEQIITNLVTNAIKYSPIDRPIELVLRSRDGAVELDVRDHGPGIPLSEQERIFERFHRLGDVMTRSVGGTGLGLYIARQLAGAMQADLLVSSQLGDGATFTLRMRTAAKLANVKRIAG
jgi:PAS domain S-box-containing protein